MLDTLSPHTPHTPLCAPHPLGVGCGRNSGTGKMQVAPAALEVKP